MYSSKNSKKSGSGFVRKQINAVLDENPTNQRPQKKIDPDIL